MSEEKSGVYSYHTFVFPFVWEGTSKKRHSLSDFRKILNDNPYWECTNLTDEFGSQINNECVYNNPKSFYKEFLYFHPYVRKAIYGYKDNIVTNYSFNSELIQNKARYIIAKNEKQYLLNVNAIRLKVYNTGIALLIMECENHGLTVDGKPQNTLNDVKNINDYGRRLLIPFIPPVPAYSACADSLTLSFEGFCSKTDFKDFINSVNESDNMPKNRSLTYIADFVKDVLMFGSKKGFTSNERKEKDLFYIYPAIDDRMFVSCCVNDAEAFYYHFGGNGAKYECKKAESISKSLYELAVVDPAGACCCDDELMREEFLKEHLYMRWAKSGTVHIIDTLSFIMFTRNPPDFLIDNHLTQYVQMFYIAIAQRASLIHFQRLCSSVSTGVDITDKTVKKHTIRQIINLQERFVAFQSQLSFYEVTPQLQGIEIYDKLKEFFFIKDESDTLKDQLASLNDVANTDLGFTLNKTATYITWLSIILTITGFNLFDTLLESSDKMPIEQCYIRVLIYSTILISSIVVATITYSYRRRK